MNGEKVGKKIWQGSLLRQEKVILAGKVFWTILAFSMNYAIVGQTVAESNFEKKFSFLPKISVFLHSIDAKPFAVLVLLLFLTRFYQVCGHCEQTGRKRFAVEALSIIASGSLFTGTAIYIYKDLGMMFVGGIQCVKSVIILGGYYLFFQKLFTIASNRYENQMNNRKRDIKIHFFEIDHAGLILFVVLCIVWGGGLFVYYPAIFMGDTEDILYMAYNYPTVLVDTVILPREGVYLTNHHPVLYTGFVRMVMDIVRKFGGGEYKFDIRMRNCAMYRECSHFVL